MVCLKWDEIMRRKTEIEMLKALAGGERWGGEVRVELRAGMSFYPRLRQLESRGLIKSESRAIRLGRPRLYYRLTERGKGRLAELTAHSQCHLLPNPNPKTTLVSIEDQGNGTEQLSRDVRSR
jgi:DNA-binding PadR family transcriptional regulator